MDIEIYLDVSGADETNRALALQKFREWYREGAEIRFNKLPFSSLIDLPEPNHFLVDLGYADVISSLRNLHARVHRLGAKVFFHFC